MQAAGQETNWIRVSYKASSLHSLMSNNTHYATSVGKGRWKSLLADSSLQKNCHIEGFNVNPSGGAKNAAVTRIGILGDNEKNCRSCNSRIGFGSKGSRLGQHDDNSCGNEFANVKAANEKKKHIKANCFILLQQTNVEEVKVAPYSFLTARDLVSNSEQRDCASLKKSTRKSRATSTSLRGTRTGRIQQPSLLISNVLAIHTICFLSFEFYLQIYVLIFPKIAFSQDIRAQNNSPCSQNFEHANGTCRPPMRTRALSSRNCMTSQTCKRRKHAFTFLVFPSVRFCEGLHGL